MKRLIPTLFFAIAIPVAFVISAICGMLLEFFVIQFLYRRPLETLLATWAVSIALIKLVQEPKAIGQVINIGNMQEISIGDLAVRVRELSGSKSPIKLISYDEAYESGFEDMPRRVPDLTRVKGLIGYEPKHDLDSILTQVIDYFRRK